MTFEERMEALTIHFELASHQIEDQRIAIAEIQHAIESLLSSVRALAETASAHERGLDKVGI